MAYAEPASYGARLIDALWREAGGALSGSVRDGRAPQGVAPSLEFSSPPLAEVVRDINKYSNNTMAQQLFLTLGLVQRGAGTSDNARAVLAQWLEEVLGADAGAVQIDNGSGLSRTQRITADGLARVLLRAWQGPLMPELAASLPLAGVDGTLRRGRGAAGRAHLKSGSLRDVVAVAGYVLGPDGRWRVLVAMVQHGQAQAARPALDALLQWAATTTAPAQRR
jgi:D-alanyl-D-alanine carboxypeptidase/D-alanyl-D-alanine-endopeptidase (penicillin-binding protein 4)